MVSLPKRFCFTARCSSTLPPWKREGKIVERRTRFFLQALMIASHRLSVISSGFFDDHVFAGAGSGHRRVEVCSTGSANRDDRHVGVSEQRGKIVIARAVDFRGKSVRRRRHRVVTANNLRAAQFRNGAGVEPGDHPATNNAEAMFHGRTAPRSFEKEVAIIRVDRIGDQRPRVLDYVEGGN